jgi:hypothetical protein
MWYECLLKGSQGKAGSQICVGGGKERRLWKTQHSRSRDSRKAEAEGWEIMGKWQQALQLHGRRNVRRPLSTILEFPKREPRPV